MPRIIISPHAMQRARERFPFFADKSRLNLKRLLAAIALKAEPYGESAIDGQYYRLGKTHANKPVILSMREDRNEGSDALVVTTVLTAEEAHNAGPWRRAD